MICKVDIWKAQVVDERAEQEYVTKGARCIDGRSCPEVMSKLYIQLDNKNEALLCAVIIMLVS